MVNLALVRSTLPKSRLYTVNEYLYSANGVDIPFSDSQIYCAEVMLGLSRRTVLTTVDGTYLPLNMVERRCYCNDTHPNGIVDINLRNIIDIDKMGL